MYLNADPDYQGRFTVPALVDLKTKKVVNNDYFHLTLYFETAWKKYHKPGAPDLYPDELREEIDTLNDPYDPALKALLTAPDRPSAVLVSDDILAVVLEQFCSNLGLRIPKDLSIVSFNNSLFSRITNPPLTTVDVNPYQLGIEAASQTINHIENPNLLATKIIVPHQLIVRESCCPPPEV